MRLAVDRKAFVIPTLTVLDSVNRSGGNAALASDLSLAPYLTPEDIQNLKAHFPGKTPTEEVLKIRATPSRPWPRLGYASWPGRIAVIRARPTARVYTASWLSWSRPG